MADTHQSSAEMRATIEFDGRSDRARIPAPLVPIAIGMIAGILLDGWLPMGWRWYATTFVVAAVCCVRRGVGRRVALIAAMFAAACAGALLHHRSFGRIPSDHLVQFTASVPAVARVRGTVLNRPRVFRRGYEPFERWNYELDRTSFLLEADSVETKSGFVPVRGRVRVSVKEAALTVDEGVRVELFGHLYRPMPPSNPGQFDWALRDRRDGILVGLSCSCAENVRRVQEHGAWSVRGPWAGFRRHVRSLLLGEMLAHGGAETTLLDAMVLGQRGAIDRELNDAFVRTGCAHFLAVSGLHVCMLGSFVWFAGRLLGAGRRGCTLLVIAVTLGYAVVVEPRPPVLRAATMVVVYCAAMLMRRPRSTANAVSLAAILILSWQPTALFGPGFQLSFGVVLGIVYLSPAVDAAFKAVYRHVAGRRTDLVPDVVAARRRRWAARGRFTSQLLAVAIAAWLAGLPIALIHFERVSFWGWLNTLLIGPLVFLVMIASFLKVVLGVVLPGLGAAWTPAVQYPSIALAWCVDALSRLPGVSTVVSAPPWWWALLYYAMISTWVLAHRRPAWWRRVATQASAWVTRRQSRDEPSPAHDGLRITVLPVGHGSGTIIETPGGGVVLYDAGGLKDQGDKAPTLRSLPALLRRRGIRCVHLLLVSHPHRDHFSSVIDIIDQLDTGPVGITPYFEELGHRDPYAADLLRRLRQRKHRVHLLTSATPPVGAGDTRLEFLWPPPEPPFRLDRNDSSLVVRVSHGGKAVLLCGDIRDDAQAWLAHRADIGADVLVMPHHGTVTKSTPRFVMESGASHLVCSRAQRPDAPDPLGALTDGRHVHDTSRGDAVEISLTNGRTSVRSVRLPGIPSPRRIEKMPAIGLAIVLLLTAGLRFLPSAPRSGLTMTVLDVGAGTAAVLELPNGDTVLYDAGASGGYDPGTGIIVPCLRHRGIRRLDAVCVSHPNLDHFGGLPSVIDRVSAGPVLVSPHFEPLSPPGTPSATLLAELLRRRHAMSVISNGSAPREYAPAILEVLWPPVEPPFELSINDSSLVLRVRYAGTSILLTGDIEEGAQQWLLDHVDVSADVLLLPHHGGVKPNSGAFIEAVNPRYVIRSSSQRNEVTDNGLLELVRGRTYFNTADVGAVTVTIDEAGTRVCGFLERHVSRPR